MSPATASGTQAVMLAKTKRARLLIRAAAVPLFALRA